MWLLQIWGRRAPKKKDNIEYEVHYRRVVTVSKGEKVIAGQLLTDGSALLPELFKYGGQEVTQDYIISEVNKIYELQGVTIARKHIELIVKQMMSRVKLLTLAKVRLLLVMWLKNGSLLKLTIN